MKKLKWLLGLCLMMLVVCGGGMSVQAEDVGSNSGTEASDFTYIEKTDGTIYIHKYNGTNETIVIPTEIDGKVVSSIGERSFADNSDLKHVIIPEGIRIGSNSFANCINLESVQLQKGLEFIPEGAFSGCTNLKSISFPTTLKEIYVFSFKDCIKIEKLKLPGSLVDIHQTSFEGCNNLTEIEFEDGISEVDFRNFPKYKLKKVIIPNSVKVIYNYRKVSFLVDFTIYANSNSYARTYANKKGIKFSCLDVHDWDKGTITTQPTAINDGIKTYTCTACKITKTEKVAKIGLPQKGKTITEPNSNNTYKVTKSASKNGTVEFAKVSKPTSNITIPDTVSVNGVTYKVTSISKNAFKNNKKLMKVTIGKNINKINTNTFYGCKNLKTITIKSTNLKSVGKNAFKGINAKAKIKVPKSKLKSYKKLFSKKGQKSTVKIVK